MPGQGLFYQLVSVESVDELDLGWPLIRLWTADPDEYAQVVRRAQALTR